MRPTASLQHGELRLEPADRGHLAQALIAVCESQPDVHRALPWIEWDQDIRTQLVEYLDEVNRLGRGGLSHHWAVYESTRLVGLIALDHTPHLTVGHWNLGYWIRNGCQGRGLASHSIDAVLEWIGRGGLTAVEIRVDPLNTAGVATAVSTAHRWAGHRFEDGDRDVEFGEDLIFHHCWLIPRLPLEVSE